ncbi:hypothetical protein [Kordiimonas sp.]|uniref:hypothetical protein n=2 Tax=Kordiimonas sp. TaxID=1970157 RepID=UPI003B51CD95
MAKGIMNRLLSYLSGRLPHSVFIEADREAFLQSLDRKAARLSNLPVGGVGNVDKAFIYSLKGNELIAKQNAPLLEHFWVLPGSARYVGIISEDAEGTKLDGYFESDHHNSLNKVFFYSFLLVLMVGTVVRIWDEAGIAEMLVVALFAILAALLVPALGWINLTIFQKREIQEVKGLLGFRELGAASET